MPDLSTGTPWHAEIDVGAVTGGTIKAAVAGRHIVVTSYTYIATDAVNVTWLSATTDLTGIMSVAAAGDIISVSDHGSGLMTTAAGEALNITTSADGINGHVSGVIM